MRCAVAYSKDIFACGLEGSVDDVKPSYDVFANEFEDVCDYLSWKNINYVPPNLIH
jgi:hypothetical protein